MKLIRLLLLFTFIAPSLQASVWKASNTWNEEEQARYQRWVGSDEVHRKIFYTSDNAILGKLPTDCADALYALRIYFSYKNSLPFVMNAPGDYQSDNGLLDNNTSKFDHIQNEGQRVRAFIRYVLREAGTLNLIKDTYPLAIKSISAGDLYVTKWSLLGESYRHSYIIKSMDKSSGNGTFFWSDAPAKVRKLKRTKKYPDFVFDGRPWGYRRWRTPDIIQAEYSEIPTTYPYSEEQYDLLERVGKNRILTAIRRLIKD